MWSAPPDRVWGLLAQVRIDWELVALAVLLVGIILGGIVIINRTREWRTQDAPPVSLDDQLQSFQALVDKGELDPKEFERIKAYLEQRAEQRAAAPPVSNPPDAGKMTGRHDDKMTGSAG